MAKTKGKKATIPAYKLVWHFGASEIGHRSYAFNPNDVVALYDALSKIGSVEIFKCDINKDGNAVSEVPMKISTEMVLKESSGDIVFEVPMIFQ